MYFVNITFLLSFLVKTNEQREYGFTFIEQKEMVGMAMKKFVEKVGHQDEEENQKVTQEN